MMDPIGLLVAAGKLALAASRLRIVLEDDPKRRRAELHLYGSATFLRLPERSSDRLGSTAARVCTKSRCRRC